MRAERRATADAAKRDRGDRVVRMTSVLAALLAAAVVLTGCSGGEDANDDAGAPALSLASPWRNADGTSVQVPAAPERIVSADLIATELLVRFGHAARIVGITDPEGAVGSDAGKLDRHPSMGTEREPDVAAITAQRPDLIIAIDGIGRRDELAAIAPLVGAPYDRNRPGAGFGWREYVRGLGDRLGLRPQTDGLVAEIDGRIAAVRNGRAPGASVAVLRVSTDGRLAALPGTYPANLILELGLDPAGTAAAHIPDAAPAECCRFLGDRELAGLRKVDVILIADTPDDGVDAVQVARGNRVFAALPAVVAGDVHGVSAPAWTVWTPGNIERALDDVERVVKPVVARTP